MCDKVAGNKKLNFDHKSRDFAFNLHFLFLGISGSFLLRLSTCPAIQGSELVLASCDDWEVSETRLDGPESVWFSFNNDEAPVRSPSPSSSSSATLLLLLLMFAVVTFVHACGKRAVLMMCTPMSSGSLASLFEGDGDEIMSKSISETNLKRKFSPIRRIYANFKSQMSSIFLLIFFLFSLERF